MEADEIKKLRSEKGWTQQQLGEAIGVTAQTILRYENNKTRARGAAKKSLERIAMEGR